MHRHLGTTANGPVVHRFLRNWFFKKNHLAESSYFVLPTAENELSEGYPVASVVNPASS